ncbi:MAG: RHS repeat-associated core domain-containing protein [Planctomycetes bacterium]|nr:RHS repeat-associated core domain-containing protein [Planctomycetota bacterium]
MRAGYGTRPVAAGQRRTIAARAVMATHETWAYDDFNRVVSAQTWWSTYPHFTGTQPPSLVEAVDGFDGIGRQVLERFRYLDDPAAGYVPIATKDLVYGYTKTGGGEDRSFRRSMATSAGFTIGSAPDGAGKLASMTLAGPGIVSQPLADWRYGGNRPIRRSFVPGIANGTEIVTEYSYNQLRHMTQITATRTGTTAPIYDLGMERDGEGNVTQHRYTKMSGAAGDWFQLDGWDRLQEAKLGVTGFTGTYAAATFDKKVTYALDEAHNRNQVDETTATGMETTSYQRNGATNEYATVTQPNGDVQSWLYDGNGNLLSDGYYLYVYDHLDRLSEAYVLTYPGGASDVNALGAPTIQVFGEGVQKKREGKETVVPRQQWRDRVQQARARAQSARAAAGVAASDPRVPNGVNAGTTGLAAASVDEAVPVVVAYYGYDPGNRRIGKLLADASAQFYAWSGWDMVEGYDLFFQPTTVWFEGAVIDEHLGYATVAGGAWVRRGYVQDHTRGIASVTDEAGVEIEVCEYDAYGRMSRTSLVGGGAGTVPSVGGQVYGFAGRQIDPETDLYYSRNRHYSAHHGRFLQSDPVGIFTDGMSSGSGYCYVGSSPLNAIDPYGLRTIVVFVLGSDPADNAFLLSNAADLCSRDPEGGMVISISANGEIADMSVFGGTLPGFPGDTYWPGHLRLMLIGHGWRGGVGGAKRGHLVSTGTANWRVAEDSAVAFIAVLANCADTDPRCPIIVNVCYSNDQSLPQNDRLVTDVSRASGGRRTVGHNGAGALINGVMIQGYQGVDSPECNVTSILPSGRLHDESYGRGGPMEVPLAKPPNTPALLGMDL